MANQGWTDPNLRNNADSITKATSAPALAMAGLPGRGCGSSSLSSLIGWFVGWGWGGYGGWAGWGTNRQAVVNQSGMNQVLVSSSVPELLQHPQSYEGKHVLIPSTTIQEIVNSRAVWVGPNQNQRILVSVTTLSAAKPLSQGQNVEVTGTASKASNGDDVRNNLGLNPADNEKVIHEGVYLRAGSVVPPGQLAPNNNGTPGRTTQTGGSNSNSNVRTNSATELMKARA